MLTQVTIKTEQIKEVDCNSKGGRPRRGDPKKPKREMRGFMLSDDAHKAIMAAADRLGVSGSSLVEALGRSLAQSQDAA